MAKVFSLLFFSLICLSTLAQKPADTEKKVSKRLQRKALAKAQYNQLKGSALLVRLHTKKSTIEAMRKMGYYDLADKTEENQASLNLSIIAAFRKEFTFCPTYFFFSDYSDYLLNKKFESIVFLDNNLKPDSSIRFTSDTFFTAEFGNIEPDTTKYYSGYTIEPKSNWNSKQEKYYYGGTEMGFGALVIESETFIQLKRPFRYYTRTLEPIRKTSKVVKRMNKKLNKFYRKANKKW